MQKIDAARYTLLDFVKDIFGGFAGTCIGKLLIIIFYR